jgi:tetratricopeptide (TPR) repeat protein
LSFIYSYDLQDYPYFSERNKMRVTSHTHLAIATIILSFAFTCYGASVSEPNATEANLTNDKEGAAEFDTTTQIKKTDELSDSTRAQIERLAKEYYKDTSDRQERALYTIIAIVAMFVIYVVFKDRGEYNKAVAEAREANKEARDASAGARDYEEKAHERFRSIDKEVATKLKEIEAKGKAQIEQLLKQAEEQRKASREQAEKQLKASREEAERQRTIGELFSKGINAKQSKDYAFAADYFEQIVRIDPTNVPALNNWGAALAYLARTKEGDEAANLLNQGCVVLEKAVKIKPNYAEAYSNWAATLVDLAKTKEGDEASNLFGQACEKCVKAIEIKPNYIEAYNNWGAALAGLAQRKKGDEAYSLLSQACEKFEKVVKLKADDDAAHNNWGTALAEQGKIKGDDKLFEQAYEKYKNAVALKPSYYDAWNNWAAMLLYQSRNKTDQERKNLLREAKEKCLKAESIKTGSGAYNLACAHASLGEEKDCQKWLKTAEQAGTLPTRQKAMSDPDLKSMRNKKWFKQLRWSAAPK